MKTPILLLALSVFAAPARAQQAPFAFSGRTLTGFGADVVVTDDFRMPMFTFRVTNLAGHFILPSLDVAAFPVRFVAVIGTVDLGFGGAFQTRDGKAAFLVRAGPSLLGGGILGEGIGGVTGGHVGVGLVLRVAPNSGIRFDIARRMYRDHYGEVTWAWEFGMGEARLGP